MPFPMRPDYEGQCIEVSKATGIRCTRRENHLGKHYADYTEGTYHKGKWHPGGWIGFVEWKNAPEDGKLASGEGI